MIQNIKALYEITRDRKKTNKAIRKLQNKRLYALLNHVYENVPFYTEYMNQINYLPTRDFKDLDDLKKLPIINKKMIREHGYESFMSKAYDKTKLNIDHSSGSTGEPFRVYRDKRFYAYQLANYFDVLMRNGYSFTDKMLTFSSPARLNTGKTMLSKLGLIRRLAVDYNLSPEESLDIVLKYKPQVIYGNPSSIDLLALEMKQKEIKIDFVKIIYVGGTAVTEGSRELWLNRFGIQPTEVYGAIEFGIMAYTEPHKRGYTLCNNQTAFEFLDSNNQEVSIGETGRLILTSLISKAMPFIRYDIGDFAETFTEENKHKENALRIKRIIGRSSDLAVLPDGRQIAYQHIHSIMNLHTGISQFKVTQKQPDFFEVLIVAESEEYFKSIKSAIEEKLQKLMGNQTTYKIILTDKILNEKGGKIKTFVPLITK